MQYKLIITGPVGSGKTTAIDSLTDQKAVRTDVSVTDAVTLARKSTTTVAMDYGTVRIADAENTVVHVYGTPGQERFDFMWDILTEGADALVILLDNNRNYPYRDLKYFSEQFADFIKDKGRLIIGITRLDVREPLLPEVYEDWMEQLGLEAEIVNIDPREKQDVLGLVHKVLELTPLDTPAEIIPEVTLSRATATPTPIVTQTIPTVAGLLKPRPADSSLDLNQKTMTAIAGLTGVTGVSITNNLGELIDSTMDDEPLNHFIAYLTGLSPNLTEAAELGPINRIMLRGPDDNNLTVFVEDERSLGVCSERSVSVPSLSQQVEDMLQWL